MTESLCAGDFVPLVGKAFQPDSHPQSLTLVKVDTPTFAGWESAPRQPFSLLLRGPRDVLVPEGLYRFTVDGAQAFELYLVPVQTHSRAYQDYQIAFN
jgi:hypothetical protein